MRKPYSVANAFVVAALLFCGALLTPAAAGDGPVWQLYRAPKGGYTVEGGPYASAEECLQRTVGADGIKDPQLSCVQFSRTGVPQGCGCECPPRLEKQRIARAIRLRHPKQHVAAAEPGCSGG